MMMAIALLLHSASIDSNWLVAVGTLALASVTARVAWLTKRSVEQIEIEAQAVTRQVEIEADQLVAMQRPLVLPAVTEEWSSRGLGRPRILLRNVGAGPAYNITGALYWPDTAGGASSLAPIALAAGEEAETQVTGAGIVVNWNSAVGYVRYQDLSKVEWQTHFRYTIDGQGNRSAEIVAVDTTEVLGEPEYNATFWVNAPWRA